MKTQMPFNNEIEKTKKEIEVLTKKLSFLEELEQTKSPVEEGYKKVYGYYPAPVGEDCYWEYFKNGYEQAQKDYKVGEHQETSQDNEWRSVALRFGEKLSDNGPGGYYDFTAGEWFEWAVFTYGKNQHIKDAVRESVKWCEEHPNENPLDWLKPQTPEETEKGMREAFVKAQQTEKWKELQRKIDEEDNDKNFKNSLDLIKEWGEKNKPPTLYQLIENWWCDVFCANSMDDMETCIDGLVSKIDKQFIPPSHNTNDYQWNKCLKMMRDNLR